MRIWARGELVVPSIEGGEDGKVSAVDEALAAFGLFAESQAPEDEECFLWPENLQAFGLWMSVQFQWDLDPQGYRYRLNLPGVQVCINNMRGVSESEKLDYFHMVQACECATLEEWRRQR